ncbi:SH3 domain-containing protein [Streptomyces bobili]|uniref:SH3 domain-containing protein n=1 Tax=Streptomyces bobili TaxID=67280 RepID=UPI00342F54A2
MISQRLKRTLLASTMGLTVAATLTVASAPAAHAVGENSRCTVNWSNFGATVAKNGWNYRTGPSPAYASRGYLYRDDRLTVLCSRGRWDYAQLSKRSKSGIPKGTKGWVRDDGLYQLGG